MPHLHETEYGRQFFDNHMPRLVKALERIAKALECQGKLKDAAQQVVSSADDTGCSEDLTVVDRQAVDLLEELLGGK